MPTIHIISQKPSTFPPVFLRKSEPKQLVLVRKSRRKVQLFLRKTDYSHSGNIRKSRRKVAEIIKKNTVKILNVGKCR